MGVSYSNVEMYIPALTELDFHSLSNLMEYDCGDSFPLDFEQNGILFGSKSREENCHDDHIPFTLKGNGDPSYECQDVSSASNSRVGGRKRATTFIRAFFSSNLEPV